MRSQRILLLAAFLAFVFRAGFARGGRDFIDGAAFSAFGVDPRITLGDGEGFLFHRLAHQAFGLLAHRLFGHFTTCLFPVPPDRMTTTKGPPQSSLKPTDLISGTRRRHQPELPAVHRTDERDSLVKSFIALLR